VYKMLEICDVNCFCTKETSKYRPVNKLKVSIERQCWCLGSNSQSQAWVVECFAVLSSTEYAHFNVDGMGVIIWCLMLNYNELVDEFYAVKT
jgi:hypothetical protein